MNTYPVKELLFERIDTEDFNAGPMVYAINKAGVKFEFLIKREKSSNQAIVLGTGTVKYSSEDWPYYARQSWMKDLPYNCIYYFDPTLYLGPINLAWCYGVQERWYLQDISEILSVILEKLGCRPADTLMMGSSGGGFTSIMLSTLLRSRCMVINPQTDFRRYRQDYVSNLASVVLKPGENWIEERANTVALMRQKGYVPYMHIVQNILVKHDIYNHITPLFKELCGLPAMCGYDRIKLDCYHNAEGHGGMPSKEKCLEFIRGDLNVPFVDYRQPQGLSGIDDSAEYELSGRNLTIRLRVSDDPDSVREYAFYLYQGRSIIDKSGYSRQTEKTYFNLEPGKYNVKCFTRSDKIRTSFNAGEISVS